VIIPALQRLIVTPDPTENIEERNDRREERREEKGK
jgi:hypothetical protein